MSSLLCMIMAIYTGHKMISGKKNRKKAQKLQRIKNKQQIHIKIIYESLALCPLGTKLTTALRCQEKSWHLFLCFFALQKIISKIMSDFVSPNTEYMQLFLFVSFGEFFFDDFLHAYRRIQRLHYSKILSSILILVYQIIIICPKKCLNL